MRRRTITTGGRRACARRRKLSHQFSSHSNCAPWCTCRHNHNRDRLYQSDLFRFYDSVPWGYRSWSNLGKKDLMVSEPPARSSHRPPQPTILRLVCRLWSTLCRLIRQVFTDEIDPPEGFRPQSSDLMQKPLIVAECHLGVINEDRTRCLQDRERNGSSHCRPVILLLIWCIWSLLQSHVVFLQCFGIAP